MKKLEFAQMENIQGGKFWGTGTTTSCNALGYCITCSHDYYFWISANTYNCSGAQQ
jgi:hypothetical protein